MALSIGIVGLPNVGKSTIFNSLTRQKAESSNYPFCTIEPNVGCVKVSDPRIDKLAQISNSEKIIYSTIDFIDIAGLVRGAHKGEGLGNQFLANIRECNVIVHILRHFKNDNITHVEGQINPKDDLEIINLELIMADLKSINKRLENRKDKEVAELRPLLEKLKNELENDKLINDLDLTRDELLMINDFKFLTQKPCLYIFNLAEADINKPVVEILKESGLENLDHEKVILVCGKMEEELNELNAEEAKNYLKELNISQTGLEKMILAGYKLLNYISMLTTGELESRSWQITKGTKAPQAAGKIHTDFEKGFVRVEVVDYDKFVELNGWQGSKEKGVARMEGKEYVIKDGDIVLFHFSK
ncbi:redox-regulated ATPase YchF [Patescibacteria group bacterium]